jgi:tetratricopeptide (TPR) repeat protein
MVPLAVRADEEFERARAHASAGIAYYAEARYEDAAHEMEAAYRIKPLADLQYNLAECYERLNRPNEAADAYQRYLDGKPRADDRSTIAHRIENLRARGTSGATTRERVVLKTIIVYREVPPPPGRAARGAAYGALVFAAGGLAAGIASAVLAGQASDEIARRANPDQPPPFDGPARDAQTRLQTYQIVCGVGFGLAALGAGAFGGLYYLGSRIDKEAKRLQVGASVGPGAAALSAWGRF